MNSEKKMSKTEYLNEKALSNKINDSQRIITCKLSRFNFSGILRPDENPEISQEDKK